MNLEDLIIKIEKGKQVGFDHFIEIENIRFWESVGIQKWNGKYKVYVGKVKEDKMVSEDFEIDVIEEFQNISEVFEYISSNSSIDIEQLNICKGQQKFNPNFETKKNFHN